MRDSITMRAQIDESRRYVSRHGPSSGQLVRAVADIL